MKRIIAILLLLATAAPCSAARQYMTPGGYVNEAADSREWTTGSGTIVNEEATESPPETQPPQIIISQFLRRFPRAGTHYNYAAKTLLGIAK